MIHLKVTQEIGGRAESQVKVSNSPS